MKIMWNCEITLFSYFFIVFSYYFHILGPGTRDWAPKRRHGPGPPPLCGLGPGSGPQNVNNMKIIWKTYENNVISQLDIIFISYLYYFHIFITILGLGPRSRPQKSYFCNIPGLTIFILFLYFCICLGWGPCPFRNLGNVWGPHRHPLDAQKPVAH